MTRLSRLPRLGFLGVGYIGRRRLNSIVEARTGEVSAVADPIAENLEQALQIAPRAAALRSLDDLLGLDLDGLVIATPSALHAEQTIAALQRGLAVFCQKPLGRNEEEVRRIVLAAKGADRLLGVDLSYRYTEALQKIRALIGAGTLGEIFAAELVFHNAYGPQPAWFYDRRLSGGGCVVDLGIHLVDAALWMLDAEVVAVTGRVFAGGKPLGESEVVEDFATARLDLATGAAVQVSCSWRLHAGRDAVIEAAFYGTKGGAALRNVNGSFVDFRAEHFTGTKSEVLAEPPDAWGGRAAVAWARQLSESCRFDSEVERQIDVAVVLDAIYGHEKKASQDSRAQP